MRTLEGHSSGVLCVSAGYTGMVASGSKSGRILLHSAESGQIVKEINGHSECVNSIAFSFDGQRFASGSS